MRCLQCSKPITLLQKLKDSDFCGAEHRTLFLEEQQRLMLERLAANRVYILRQSGWLNNPLVDDEDLVPELSPVQEPLPDIRLCPFISEWSDPPSRLAAPRYAGEPALSGVAPMPPLLAVSLARGPAAHWALIPLVVEACKGPSGPAGAPVPCVQDEATLPGRAAVRLQGRVAENGCPRVAGMLRLQAGGPASIAVLAGASAGLAAQTGAMALKPRLTAGSPSELSLQFLGRFFRSRPGGPRQGSSPWRSLPLELRAEDFDGIARRLPSAPVAERTAAGLAKPIPLPLPLPGPIAHGRAAIMEGALLAESASTAAPGIPALGSIGPVPCGLLVSQAVGPTHPGLAAVHYARIGTAFLEAKAASPIFASLGAQGPNAGRPATMGTLFRLPPYGPVTGQTDRQAIPGVPRHGQTPPHGFPELPLRALAERVPAMVKRAYKWHPKSPVQDEKIPASETTLTGTPETLAPLPHLPTCSAEPGMEMRLRSCQVAPGPLPARDAARTGDLHAVAGLGTCPPEAFRVAEIIPAAVLVPGTSLAPGTSARFYRARPDGVASAPTGRSQGRAEFAGLRPDSALLPLLLQPAASPSLHLAGGLPQISCESPMAKPAAAGYEETGPHFSQLPAEYALAPAGLSLKTSLAPAFLGRAYRMRPRGAVADPGLPAWTAILPAAAADPVARPFVFAAGLRPATNLVPAFLNRAFRMRPRGPMQGQISRNLAAINTGSILSSIPSLPALPSSTIKACTPLLLERVYRMRPRGPVGGRNLSSYEAIQPGAVQISMAARLPELVGPKRPLATSWKIERRGMGAAMETRKREEKHKLSPYR
ncbi:MAG TPA: hypothetical protein VMZ52_14755 [Bryobacteraceae bacterium]|nr:hypothetical protein [Bryobacteraceae bacterium]